MIEAHSAGGLQMVGATNSVSGHHTLSRIFEDGNKERAEIIARIMVRILGVGAVGAIKLSRIDGISMGVVQFLYVIIW